MVRLIVRTRTDTTAELTRQAVGIILVRLAQSNEDGTGELYERVMDGWQHRTERSRMTLNMTCDERNLLRSAMPTELGLLRVKFADIAPGGAQSPLTGQEGQT